jgi:hypothetical protein
MEIAIRSGFANLIALGLLLLVTIPACRTRSRPDAHEVRISQWQTDLQATTATYAGTPLSGPLPAPAEPIEPATARVAEVQLIVLNDAEPPLTLPDEFSPLARHMRLVIAQDQGRPIRATPSLRTVRYASGEPADVLLATLRDDPRADAHEPIRLVVAPGLTSEARIESDDFSLNISLTAPESGDNLLVAVRQRLATPSPATQPSGPHNEIAMLDPLTPDVQSLAFVLPETALGAIVCHIALTPAADVEDADELLQAASAAAAEAPERDAKPGDGLASVHTSALRAMIFPERRRAALVYLASETGAAITADIALVASDEMLQTLIERIIPQTLLADPPPSSKTLGWLLEKTTLELLGAQMAQGLDPELAAILARHAGEAGRGSASLSAIVRAAANLQDLQARIFAENFIYLEDSSPAARVRAFDWLAARGKAPEGYDPLGPPKARRDALEQARARMSEAK